MQYVLDSEAAVQFVAEEDSAVVRAADAGTGGSTVDITPGCLEVHQVGHAFDAGVPVADFLAPAAVDLDRRLAYSGCSWMKSA